MKLNQFWWIKKLSSGKLCQFGRSEYEKWRIVETGCPRLFSTKKDALEKCMTGEIPVKVEIREVKQ